MITKKLTPIFLSQTIITVTKTLSILILAPFFSRAFAAEASFSKEIAPVLMRKCLACHNTEKKKGGYEMETYESLLKPGKSKLTPIEPGQPEKSELFHRITTLDPDDRMPQKDDPLAPETITLIKDWIAQGASFDGADKNALLASLIPTTYPVPPKH